MKYLLIFLSSFIVFAANAAPEPKDVNVVNTPDVNVVTMPPVDVTIPPVEVILPETMDTNIVNTPGVNVVNTPTVVIGNDAESPIPVTLDGVDGSQPKINLIVANPTEVNAGITVYFSASVIGGDAPLAYLWEFGDGDDYFGINADKFYDFPGLYIVTLTVTDADGDVASDAVVVKVGEEDTEPFISEIVTVQSPVSGVAPLSVQFVPSVINDNPPSSFYWEFGDGTTSSLEVTYHTYINPGEYNVTLRVTDVDGDFSWHTITIPVSSP